ncbi:MerR family transcriptional regulator [bacterium]|jgi:DNA-binding transcriptional MerR regulator|nr:MerR family transcriptional regulator [bacterium]MBT4495198.1 MerR family transcriptional regulator [bacterium]MBT4764398.1 MerR family transcriptional regulator [bacterium]MBT5401770.1 MerR family transcriptional regulator [bacterium]MBT5942054.1 MerR family transcriptional regulator [bacterium]
MKNDLLKIGQLAQIVGVLPSTINYYTNEGLLKSDGRSQGGYRLYKKVKAIKQIKRIQFLKDKKRLRIDEIKKVIKR